MRSVQKIGKRTLVVLVLKAEREEVHDQVARVVLALEDVREELWVQLDGAPEHDDGLGRPASLAALARLRKERLREALLEQRKDAAEDEVKVGRAVQLGQVERERVRRRARIGAVLESGLGVLGEENLEQLETAAREQPADVFAPEHDRAEPADDAALIGLAREGSVKERAQ